MKKFSFWAIVILAIIGILFAIRGARCAETLIKGESYPAVYYLMDGKRYVFPNYGTYASWYSDFATVVQVTDAELISYPIGGNVTYRPSSLVKITTDPKTYAVDKGGVLRWITSEDLAIKLYGEDWNTKVADVPDEFFVNYKIGAPVYSEADYNPITELLAVASIADDKSMVGGANEPAQEPQVLLPAPEPEPVPAPLPEVIIITNPVQDLHFERITFTPGPFEPQSRRAKIEVFDGAGDGISDVSFTIVASDDTGTQTLINQHRTLDIQPGETSSPDRFQVGTTLPGEIKSLVIKDIVLTGYSSGNTYQVPFDITIL